MIFRYLQKLANGRSLLALFALSLLFNLVLFPLSAKMAGEQPGSSLDVHFFYTPEQARENISQHSEASRQIAIVTHLTLDTIYPLLYAFLFGALILFLLRPLAAEHSAAQKLVYLPFAILIADFIENAGIVAMFSLYPAWYPGLARATGIFTTLKWLLVLVTLVTIAGLIVLRRVKRRAKT